MPRLQDDIFAECEEWGEDRVQLYVETQLVDPERIHRLEWLNKKARERASSVDPEWTGLTEDVRRSLLTGWQSGMPAAASALYARWWQLETWLRSLLYVELKAACGSNWHDCLPKASELRQERDGDFHYMSTPDAQNRLAYADASALFKVTLDRWDLFSSYFPSKTIWGGRIEELLAIRNRIGHCRRPHADDLARLEQTLRDLNGGAFAATSAFNHQWIASSEWVDEVVAGWLQKRHETAGRLIEHAARQYDTIFELRFSRRPWAADLDEKASIAGVPGYVWHAFWYFRGARPFHLDKFWRDIRRYHNTLMLVCAESPSSLSVSFPAMQDPKMIADAIGRCFDAALYAIGHGDTREDYYTHWAAQYSELDTRVHAGSTPWAMVDECMRGVSIFGA